MNIVKTYINIFDGKYHKKNLKHKQLLAILLYYRFDFFYYLKLDNF